MNTEIKRFLFKIILTTLILALLGALLFCFIIPQYYLSIFPWLLLFFAAVTFLVHAWQINLAKKDMAKVSRSSMIATMLRLFLYSAVAIIYFATHPENAVIFVISLVILYVVFTYIEIIDLTQFIRKRKK